jgi:DNA-directed RNA polymerase specialized sigma24 family protein
MLLLTSAGLAIAGFSVGILSLFLYFSARERIQHLRWDVDDRRSELALLSDKFQELQAQLERFQVQFEDIEQRRTSLLDFTSESPDLSLSRRGQVLRLHQRGESPAQIASALGVSEGEVKLTVALHGFGSGKSE